jgi:hypothetical protein
MNSCVTAEKYSFPVQRSSFFMECKGTAPWKGNDP